MHHKSVLLIALLPFFTSAIPAPGNVNVPITDAEWSALQAGGLARRSPATVNQPITDSEWEALEAGGLSKRANDIAFAKRDSVMNCGHLVTGKGGSNGHGKWIPVAQFSDLANQFCKLQELLHLFLKGSWLYGSLANACASDQAELILARTSTKATRLQIPILSLWPTKKTITCLVHLVT